MTTIQILADTQQVITPHLIIALMVLLLFGITITVCLIKYGVEKTMIFSGVFTGLIGVILTYYFTNSQTEQTKSEKMQIRESAEKTEINLEKENMKMRQSIKDLRDQLAKYEANEEGV